jgi:hypothetical protein
MRVWKRELAKRRGDAAAASLMARTRTRYEELCSSRKEFSHRALNAHVTRFMLPGLALYQVLLEEGEDRETALKTVEHLFVTMLQPARKRLALLGRLPIFFRLIRTGARWSMKFAFPPVGWEAEWLEDNTDCIAFNIQRCFYVNELKQYGAPELTPIFCLGDDVLYDGVSPYLSWERTETMGRGNTHCNFRFRRTTRAERAEGRERTGDSHLSGKDPAN